MDDETQVLEAIGAKELELQVKDLGPQLAWRTVYMIEYVRTSSFLGNRKHSNDLKSLGRYSYTHYSTTTPISSSARLSNIANFKRMANFSCSTTGFDVPQVGVCVDCVALRETRI